VPKELVSKETSHLCPKTEKKGCPKKTIKKERTSRPWTRAPHIQPGRQRRAVPKKNVSVEGNTFSKRTHSNRAGLGFSCLVS
jgi:hypothetical protein